MKVSDLFLKVVILWVLISASILWTNWIVCETLMSNSWDCTQWHINGEKDHQSSTCDQFTRKAKK